jgi:hypothetical protein
MQPGQPLDPVCHPSLAEHLALSVDHAHIVVFLRPVDPDIDHAPSFPSTITSLEEYAAP